MICEKYTTAGPIEAEALAGIIRRSKKQTRRWRVMACERERDPTLLCD